MGWRGQDNREKDWEAERRALPFYKRYAWERIIWLVIAALIVAIAYKLRSL